MSRPTSPSVDSHSASLAPIEPELSSLVRSSMEEVINSWTAPDEFPTPVSPSKKSNHPRNASHGRNHQISPRDRFRLAVHKVISMHRSMRAIHVRGRAGGEPGIDPRRASADALHGQIRQNCVIEVFDYSTVRCSESRKMGNEEFLDFMADPQTSSKGAWAKVRWINIGGLSWDVIKAVSIKHELHPLALEDVFGSRKQAPSKADYYPKHLFLRVSAHELYDSEEEADESASLYSYIPQSSKPVDVEQGLTGSRRSASRISTWIASNVDIRAEKLRKRQKEEAVLEALKERDRVHVKSSFFFIFLLRDGTVISIHPNLSGNIDFTIPITERLTMVDTLLRNTADPSLLVQSLLDLIVDRILDITDEYRLRIGKFERRILIRTKISTVRDLHILSGDLILRRRTLEPIKSLLYGLRRYDSDRCSALLDPSESDQTVVGYMSPRSLIYLADVYDHMDYCLTSLEMFSNIAENLINYAFNSTSNDMNQFMRMLTIVTIIFLPLSLLSGYFGMNFTFMWSVYGYGSDIFFWEIAIPMLIIIVPLFLWKDLVRLCHSVKKMRAKQVVMTNANSR